MSKIEDFLFNDDINDEIFSTSYHKTKIHKEKYNDRFTILYSKIYEDGLRQGAYSVCGYYDGIDRVLYDNSYELDEIIPEDVDFRKQNFSYIEKLINHDVDMYIEEYAFQHKEELKDISKETYEKKDDWRLNRYKEEIRKAFIKGDNLESLFEGFYEKSLLTSSSDYYSKEIITQYLDNPRKVVKEYADKIIESSKEDLGMSIYIYEDKTKYLNQIKTNYNDFKNLYVNKKIYNAIKDLDIKTLTITIKYNHNDFTFKYDYLTLKRDLASDSRFSYTYLSSYDPVVEFLIENKKENETNLRAFDFSHISKITYGKNELYRNDNVEKIKNKDMER